MNENSISTFYILDFDRTLFMTEKSVEIMRGIVALHNSELATVLEKRFEEYTLLGESFSVREFIVESVGEEEMEKIAAKYHETAMQYDLLHEGAKELLAYIRAEDGAQLGILTYGSQLGQDLKIRAAAGLENIPFLVTGETYKGALIASWRQNDGLYHLPEELGGYAVKTIVFVDDKPFSFKGIPIDCIGYLVKSMYDAGLEKLPLNVKIVTNLNEVISGEKERLASAYSGQIDKP